MNATVTDITARTAALGRVVDAMLTHRAGESVDFVALGMVLHTECLTTEWAWTIVLLGADEAELARVSVRPNFGGLAAPAPYPFAKRFVVLAQVGRVVLADADSLASALADALVLLHERWTA